MNNYLTFNSDLTETAKELLGSFKVKLLRDIKLKQDRERQLDFFIEKQRLINERKEQNIQDGINKLEPKKALVDRQMAQQMASKKYHIDTNNKVTFVKEVKLESLPL